MAGIATFQATTCLTFGPGAVVQAGEIARGLGIARALVVTDPGLVKAGIADRLIGVLAQAGVESTVFAAVEPNPSVETVEKAAALYRESGAQGLVAVGGGSAIDVAKGAGILAGNLGPLTAYVGAGKVANPLPPLIAVPTTVGTGSEVTVSAVITVRAERRKVVISSPYLAPRQALLDPDLVASLPEALVAATGMDALTHAVESVISTLATPFSDALALEAIRLIGQHLGAGARSADAAARAHLLYASTLAGMAFSNARVGLVHGMAHPLGAYHDLPHGLANAILLPYVLAFNAPACEAQLARVATALGEAPTADAATVAVRRLGAEAGIPARLGQVGVTGAFIAEMAQDAFASANAQVVNPRKPALAEVVALYEQAL